MAIAGSLPGSGAVAPARTRRQWLLAFIAALLTALTIWDYSDPAKRGIAQGDSGNADATVPVGGGSSRTTHPLDVRQDLFSEAARLRHLLDSAKVIRQRYHAIVVPYAEAMAGIAALHPSGQTAHEAAEHAISSLLPVGVELKDMLLTELPSRIPGIVNVRANVSLTSGDSQAFVKALLALGDSANGFLWTSVSIAADASGHHLQATGILNILTVEHAE